MQLRRFPRHRSLVLLLIGTLSLTCAAQPALAQVSGSDRAVDEALLGPMGGRFDLGTPVFTPPPTSRPAGAGGQGEYRLPSLGAQSISLNGMDETRLGRAWMRQFLAQVSPWDDPITQQYLESVVQRLLPFSGVGPIDPAVLLLSSRQLNAFAVPGGVIGVNTGLFLSAPDRDAFASVIAHELGHLSQRHFARNVQQASRSQMPTLAAMLAGMVIAASGAGDVGIATIAGSQAAAMQNQLAYSRQYEQEADRAGLDILARAGMDPQAMPRMFRALQRTASLQGSSPPEFLLTHPLTEGRISASQARANQLHVAYQPPGPEYDMIRARVVLAMYMDDPSQARERLRSDITDPDALAYLQALTLTLQHRTEEALAAFDALAARQPDLLLIPASAADAALDAGRFDEALARARQLLRIAPDYYPAQVLEARAELSSDPSSAFDTLRRVAERRPEDPQVWGLLAEAAGRAGYEGWGHLALAEQAQLTGQVSTGLRQLDIGAHVAEQNGDYVMLDRLRARRDALTQYRRDIEQF
ncbi:M48 family metalloprotease [Halotalea alkalilenta]|uniref:M48 family metalloprotease n=1 Tax=Halotalea alkalilenta TaxID=376489 RepID=UPI0009DD1F90|nr:M48 family metalloprotease [Halotalea alkalilenta]